MKEIRLRVDYDKMRWHIEHYRRNGYELTNIHIAPKSGRIKFAVLLGTEDKIIIQPKPPQKFRNRRE
jgi:hypothetical protein